MNDAAQTPRYFTLGEAHRVVLLVLQLRELLAAAERRALDAAR